MSSEFKQNISVKPAIIIEDPALAIVASAILDNMLERTKIKSGDIKSINEYPEVTIITGAKYKEEYQDIKYYDSTRLAKHTGAQIAIMPDRKIEPNDRLYNQLPIIHGLEPITKADIEGIEENIMNFINPQNYEKEKKYIETMKKIEKWSEALSYIIENNGNIGMVLPPDNIIFKVSPASDRIVSRDKKAKANDPKRFDVKDITLGIGGLSPQSTKEGIDHYGMNHDGLLIVDVISKTPYGVPYVIDKVNNPDKESSHPNPFNNIEESARGLNFEDSKGKSFFPTDKASMALLCNTLHFGADKIKNITKANFVHIIDAGVSKIPKLLAGRYNDENSVKAPDAKDVIVIIGTSANNATKQVDKAIERNAELKGKYLVEYPSSVNQKRVDGALEQVMTASDNKKAGKMIQAVINHTIKATKAKYEEKGIEIDKIFVVSACTEANIAMKKAGIDMVEHVVVDDMKIGLDKAVEKSRELMNSAKSMTRFVNRDRSPRAAVPGH